MREKHFQPSYIQTFNEKNSMEKDVKKERDVFLKQSFSRGKTHFAASTRGSSGCSQQF